MFILSIKATIIFLYFKNIKYIYLKYKIYFTRMFILSIKYVFIQIW